MTASTSSANAFNDKVSTSAGPPIICVEHLIKYYTASNTELATLVNVCKSWRDAGIEVILNDASLFVKIQKQQQNGQQSMGLGENPVRYSYSYTDDNNAMGLDEDPVRYNHHYTDDYNGGDQNCDKNSGFRNERPMGTFSFQSLLLPSMLRAMFSSSFSNTMNYENVGYTYNDNDFDDTYCVSWFPGTGASPISVDIGPAPALPAATRGNSRMRSSRKNADKNDGLLSRRKLCAREWYGYSAPFDILRQFGYTYVFIEEIIKKWIHLNDCSSMPPLTSDPGKLASNAYSRQMRGERNDDDTTGYIPHRSFAVRGSTLAYPVRAHRPPRLVRATFSVGHLQTSDSKGVSCTDKDCSNNNANSGANNNQTHRAVQFLDAPGTHAVRMRTASFERLVEQPVTVFLVGIACEDGCFFSGLQNRFECGHLYPDNYRDSQMDFSNVSISASNHTADANLNTSGASGDSDDDEDYSVPEVDEVVRGLSGPGIWHLYTCIFDHDKSAIRVDGQLESDGYDDVMSTTNNCGNGSLDGLSIGSDHRFDMSLCDGGGYEGEGEGAIAEIAVFKGRLTEDDLQIMESYFLDKYSIPRGRDESLEYDEWRRQAHALLMQSPRWDPQVRQVRNDMTDGSDSNENSTSCWPSIPLRVAARHRNVAWHKYDPVTGKQLRVSRIGSKSTGSSDW